MPVSPVRSRPCPLPIDRSPPKPRPRRHAGRRPHRVGLLTPDRRLPAAERRPSARLRVERTVLRQSAPYWRSLPAVLQHPPRRIPARADPDAELTAFTNPSATDPFASDGPQPNDVTAALFLLVRSQHLSPETFICPLARN